MRLCHIIIIMLLPRMQAATLAVALAGTAVVGWDATLSPTCSADPLGTCNRQLQDALATRCAASSASCAVLLQPGNYSWALGVPVVANGLVDLTISGRGAVLQLTGPDTCLLYTSPSPRD